MEPRGAARPARPDDRRPAARARRLPEAAGGGRADRGAGAALPAAAGLRLGRGRGRRRAGRDRPEVQPALRPRHPDRLRPGAAVDPDHADPGRHRRRAEDEQVARQLRRRHRPAGGDVRPADADPRRGDGRVLPAAARRGAAGGRPPNEAKRALGRRIVERFHGDGPPARPPRSTSTGSSSSARRPRRSRSSTSAPTRATDGGAGPPAGADGRRLRDQLERGAAPDQAGRRQARRRAAARRDPRPRARRARRARSCRSGKRRFRRLCLSAPRPA